MSNIAHIARSSDPLGLIAIFGVDTKPIHFAQQTLRKNSVMLKMYKELGFDIKTDSQDAGLCYVSLTFENPSIGE